MKLQLGLSSEPIETRLALTLHGVGLLRGEYLCRRIHQYVTMPECRAYIGQYLERVCALFAPDPVWYRTTELETTKLNVLDGVDHVVEEPNTIVGLRGIRRALRFKEAFILELATVAEVAARWSNLHLLLPFVSDPSEVRFAQACMREVGFQNQLGIMAEIPSVVLCLPDYLDLGVRNVTVGVNDLSSLTLGAARRSSQHDPLHPAMQRLLHLAREQSRRADVTLAVAGQLSEQLLRRVEALGYDYAIVHYSDLPNVLGSEGLDLPYRDDLQRIKEATRQRVRTSRGSRL